MVNEDEEIILGRDQTYEDSNSLSIEKISILVVSCVSIGMLTGLLGATLSFLAENLSTELPSIISLLIVKSIGFLLGTYSSSYLYTSFNVCCLLGLSCLSISFGVCSLAFITDRTAFYLTSFILGLGLGLSYNGIDALYNRSSMSMIRWFHLLIAFGACFSTLLLLPSTISTDNYISSTKNGTQSFRVRREITNETILTFNLSSSTRKIVTKPVVVASDILAGSLYTKPPFNIESSTSKSMCSQFYCCYDLNNGNDTFICQEETKNQSRDCKDVFSSCQISLSNVCHVNKSNIWCRIDQRCDNETIVNCSISSIINITTTHRNKPSTADSDNDDLSQNLFYLKTRLFFHSLTSIHLLYLSLAFSFFLLGIFYSILAIRGEGSNISLTINFNSLSLILLKPYQISMSSHSQISLLSDRSTRQFMILILLFYFLLFGIDSSCTYITYLFGIHSNLSKTKSLLLQFCYFSGRFLDMFISYIWFLWNQFLKKQPSLYSIKFLIFFRLVVLFIICSINLFHQVLYFLFFTIGFFVTSLSSLMLHWIERDLGSNDLMCQMILFTMILSEMIFPIIVFYQMQYSIQVYLSICLSVLIGLFFMISYTSKKWQRHRLYRLVPAAIDMDDGESQENSDNERMKDMKVQ